jgi:hypothetical protein
MKLPNPTEVNCEYHPLKVAVERCEICGKNLCCDCAKNLEIVERIFKNNTLNNKRACIPCYWKYFETKGPTFNSIFSFFMFLLFGSLFIILAKPSFQYTDEVFPISIFFLVLMIGYLSYFFYIIPTGKKNATLEKNRFLNGLANSVKKKE